MRSAYYHARGRLTLGLRLARAWRSTKARAGAAVRLPLDALLALLAVLVRQKEEPLRGEAHGPGRGGILATGAGSSLLICREGARSSGGPHVPEWEVPPLAGAPCEGVHLPAEPARAHAAAGDNSVGVQGTTGSGGSGFKEGRTLGLRRGARVQGGGQLHKGTVQGRDAAAWGHITPAAHQKYQ